MQPIIKNIFVLLLTLYCIGTQAQIIENTTKWHNYAHGGFKVEPQDLQGYVIAGHRHFAGQANHSVYISQFDEFGQFQWTQTHTTNLNLVYTFWRSFCKASYPAGYFILTSTNDKKSYAVMTNAGGQKLWDRVSSQPRQVNYKDVCPTPDGGYMACGDNSDHDLAEVSKFNAYGELVWSREYDDPSLSVWWAIEPAIGGGYVLSGSGLSHVAKIDEAGELEWHKTLDAGIAPSGSHYIAGNESDIMVLPGGEGFIMTGNTSAGPYTNYYTAVYTARYDWAGNLLWVKICDQMATNFSPYKSVAANNTITGFDQNKIITFWNKGLPGSGAMYARTLHLANGAMGPIINLYNTIPVSQAFATRAHGKLVIGGMSNNYSKVYTYTNAEILYSNLSLSAPGNADEMELDTEDSNLDRAAPSEPVNVDDFNVFPNPATGNIQVSGKWTAGALVRIRDLNGRVIQERAIINEGETPVSFDLNGQASGIYLVEMNGSHGLLVKKLILE